MPASDAGSSSSPPVRSSAISGLSGPAGRGTVDGGPHGEVRALAVGLTLAPHGPAQGDGLHEPVAERRSEAEHAPAPGDEIEAGDLAGEHGGVAPVSGQGEPHPQRHPGHPWAQAGRQHDGVPQRPLAHEDDADSIGLGPDGLGPQSLPRRLPGGTVLSRRRRLGRLGVDTGVTHPTRPIGAAYGAPSPGEGPTQARSHQPPTSRARPAWASRSSAPHRAGRSSPTARASSSREVGSGDSAS